MTRQLVKWHGKMVELIPRPLAPAYVPLPWDWSEYPSWIEKPIAVPREHQLRVAARLVHRLLTKRLKQLAPRKSVQLREYRTIKNPTPKQVTPKVDNTERNAKIRKLREKGWTLKRIARRLDISINAVSRVTRGKSYVKRSESYEERLAQVYELADKGYPPLEIAKRLGRNNSTVYRALQKRKQENDS